MKKNRYLLSIPKQWAYLSSFYSVIVLLALAAMTSCDDEEPGQAPLDIGSLEASSTEVIIDFDTPIEDVVTFSWHAEKAPTIQYELEFAAGGKSHTVNVMSEVSKRFIHAQFNTIMVDKLQLAIGKPSNVDVTLHAKVTKGDKTATSNTITISVTPSQLIPEPPLETVTLSTARSQAIIDMVNPLGDAASFSWGNETNVFIEYKLVLTAGTKSETIDVLSEIGKEFTNAEFNDILVDKLQLEVGKVATITAVVNASVTISDKKVSSNEVTISVTPSAKDLPAPAYPKMWIVGNATPNGWDIGNPNVMVNDPTNIYQFKFNENLNAGEFKIPVATGNWGGDFYMPPTNHPDLSSTDVTLIPGGNPDNKWQISNAGAYKVLLNISGSNPFIKITPFTPYSNLYIIGNATEAGWDANNPIAMTVDPGNANVFTWTGELKSAGRGQFRFLVSPGDLNGSGFVAPTSGASITATQLAFTLTGTPANGFRVKEGEDGTYKITINQLKETISIVKQ
jgi:starch-binding outer membrane protein SusE/F